MAESKYNVQNLVPFTSDQSREEAVKNGAKGGKASGEARRAYKNQREALNMILRLAVPQSSSTEALRKALKEFGIENEEQNLGTALALRQVIKALSGDTVAYNAISNRADGMPMAKQDITTGGEKITGLNVGFENYEKKD